MRRALDAVPRSLTLSGRPVSVVGTALVYVCGITPYDVTHLGHAATFVWADAAVRVMRHLGADVHVCRNVTDVDDVLSAAALRAGAPFDRFAAVTQFAFERDMADLAVGRPTTEPRARAYVPQVVALAATLVGNGSAYAAGGSVFFRGAPVTAGIDDADTLLREYGEDLADPAKEHPHDLPLWRASGPDEPAWPSPWGPGRPGWHAECTAMALSTYGPALDLHAGGADLRFPHHAYETAQAEAATGVRPFARTWLHPGTVCSSGRKMAKSAGNLVLVVDLLRIVPAAAVRLLILDRPWPLNWDYEPAALDAAAARLERLHAAAGRPGGSDAALRDVEAALAEDLDVPRALAIAEEAGGKAARLAVRVLALA